MSKTFWDFVEGEDALHRVLRAVTACALGLKPPKPFGVCSYCPAQGICEPIKEGIVATVREVLEVQK